MLPTKDDVTAARQIWVNRQLKEAEDQKRREAEAAARQEENYQIAATSLLSKLKQEILTAMASGKKECYLRVGNSRAHAGFPWEQKETRVADIIVGRIESATNEYNAVRGVEKHHWIDYGYGCDRDAYDFFPAVKVTWL